jgi:hypothetical protein
MGSRFGLLGGEQSEDGGSREQRPGIGIGWLARHGGGCTGMGGGG